MGALDLNEPDGLFRSSLNLDGLGFEPTDHRFVDVVERFFFCMALRYAAGQCRILGDDVAVFTWSQYYLSLIHI